MITSTDILNMNFYKKEQFTGSYLGMRYLIKKSTEPVAIENNASETEKSAFLSDNAGADAKPQTTDVFLVTIWPGPYNYASTSDEKKTAARFPFTEEGRQQVVDWLNEQWADRQDEWPKR